MALKIGERAPDFTLIDHLERKITLSNYLGKSNVVMAFFPLAWTPV